MLKKRTLWLLSLFCILCLSFLSWTLCYAADNDSNTVKVAYFDMGVYYKVENGVSQSYDRAYLDKVSEYTDLEFEYVDCGTWKQALEMLKNHEVDLVGTTQWNAEREEDYEFCLESYGYTIATLATLSQSGIVYEDYDAIGNATVGCTTNYVRRSEMDQLFADHNIHPEVKTYDTQQDLQEALMSGDIDIIAANSHTLIDNLSVIERFSYAPYYFISWKGNTSLVDAIDDAIIKMNLYDDVDIRNMVKQWLPELVTVPLTKDELNCIDQSGTFTLYFDTNTRPLSWRDSAGEMQGDLKDVCNLLSERTGLKFDYAFVQDVDQSVLQEPNSVDNFTFVETGNGEPSNDSGVSDALLKKTFCFYHRIGEDYEPNQSYTVAIPTNRPAIYSYISTTYPTYTIIEYQDPTVCLEALQDGKVDLAFMCDSIADCSMIENNIHNCTSIPTSQIDVGIGLKFNGENAELLKNITNKGLSMISADEISEIELRHALETTPKVTLSYVVNQHAGLSITIAVLVVILLFIVFVTLERNRVIKKQSQLVEAADKAKTDFFARMSHDMRTPMNGILGMVALSKDECSPEVLHQNLNKIEDSGTYMLGLINDTLDLQKLDAGKFQIQTQAIYRQSFVDGLTDMIKASAKQRSIEFRVENKNIDLDCYVKADPMRLKQIFVNLLSNAIKFTPEGGCVCFSMECMAKDGDIEHDRFQVFDTGIGIRKEFLDGDIFEPYAQENNSFTTRYAGSGLGLAITKNLVEMMGGTIHIDSELGEGTCVTVCLDFEVEKTEKARNEESVRAQNDEKTSERLRGKRILMCEDNLLNVEIARRLLENVGCIVHHEVNGRAGLEAFRESEAFYYDVVLMDIRMPEMDGLQAAREIRALDRPDALTIPIIAVSANAYAEDIQASKQAGMSDYLTKPINPQAMYDAIARA